MNILNFIKFNLTENIFFNQREYYTICMGLKKINVYQGDGVE